MRQSAIGILFYRTIAAPNRVQKNTASPTKAVCLTSSALDVPAAPVEVAADTALVTTVLRVTDVVDPPWTRSNVVPPMIWVTRDAPWDTTVVVPPATDVEVVPPATEASTTTAVVTVNCEDGSCSEERVACVGNEGGTDVPPPAFDVVTVVPSILNDRCDKHQ